MAARSIASLSITFGLVSIPVKLYGATESAAGIRFKLMGAGGVRLRQQYVAEQAPEPVERLEEPEPVTAAPTSRSAASSQVLDFPRRETSAPIPDSDPAAAATVERADMVKGCEFEKGKFVLFTADELKALEEASRQTIDIVAFAPNGSVDPVYYDKAYFLAPDKRGGKPYSLLLRAMQATGRCALGKWAWRSKEYVVQIRPVAGGMVLQQLLYADEVRSIDALGIDVVQVGDAELDLAKQLIEQIAVDAYDPTQFVDEEKARILAAVEQKVAGQQVVAPEHREPAVGANVLDLMSALRASLATKAPAPPGSRKAPKRSAPKADDPAVKKARAKGSTT